MTQLLHKKLIYEILANNVLKFFSTKNGFVTINPYRDRVYTSQTQWLLLRVEACDTFNESNPHADP